MCTSSEHETIDDRTSREASHLVYLRRIRPHGENQPTGAPDDSPAKVARKLRYRLQRQAAKLLPGERVRDCARSIAPLAENVRVRVNPATHSAYYRNLQQCESYSCPLCAERRSMEDRRDLSIAMAEATKQNLFPLLITLTLRHHRGDSLDDMRAALTKAFDKTFNGSRWQKLKKEYSVGFKVRSWEVTYGAHGWHPHIHALFFLEIELAGRWLEKFANDLRGRWIAELQRLGYDASWANGLDVRTADSDIADYIAKFGREPSQPGRWGADSEIARSPVKKAHQDGFTPFELLAVSAGESGAVERFLQVFGGEAAEAQKLAGALYVEYFQSFKGKPRLHWGSAWDALGMDAALESFLAQNPPQTDAFDALTVERDSWLDVAGRWVGGKLGADLRADLLNVAADMRGAALAAWLAEYGIRGQISAEYWQWGADLVHRVSISPEGEGWRRVL